MLSPLEFLAFAIIYQAEIGLLSPKRVKDAKAFFYSDRFKFICWFLWTQHPYEWLRPDKMRQKIFKNLKNPEYRKQLLGGGIRQRLANLILTQREEK